MTILFMRDLIFIQIVKYINEGHYLISGCCIKANFLLICMWIQKYIIYNLRVKLFYLSSRNILFHYLSHYIKEFKLFCIVSTLKLSVNRNEKFLRNILSLFVGAE